MDALPVFAAQFLWFLLAWACLARLVAWPWTLALSPDARLAFWIAPQMFRVLGLGLLVPALAPGLSPQFARATAAGDATTSVLAMVAFVALRTGSRHARTLVWAATIVGACDLAIAMPHAAHVRAAANLAAQWYVATAMVPLMVVCHVACLATLVATRPGVRS